MSSALICLNCGNEYGADCCDNPRPAGDGTLGGIGFPPPESIAVAKDPPPGEVQTPAQPADAGIWVGADVVPEGAFRISSLGYGRSGKTTYLGMLYFLLTQGRFPGYRFAWSDSLRELETIRAQLFRSPQQGGPAFPPRTDVDKTLFLHLGLRRWADARYCDVYFPEFSGEDVARVWSEGSYPKNLQFLKDFNGYMVFVDCSATSALDTGRYLSLIAGLLELKGGLRLEEPVAVLLSKWDLVADQGLSPEEFFKRRFGGLYEAWRGQCKALEVFGVSAVGDVRELTGHDGLPLKRDGEVLRVPAPAREVLPDDETCFHYRPRNVSRPLLWLLDQLGGQA
ncbi:MAG: hypothetical protein KDD82_02790 [Planctomycetes bacterium]|nr:hypothetical protein [Planctomycetota bacterium]